MDQKLQDELQQLMSFKPITSDTDATRALITYVAKRLQKIGLKVMIHSDGDFYSLVAGSRSLKRSALLLQAHIDVVPAPNKLFVLRRAGDRLLGRGTYDMLFATASFIVALENLAASGQLDNIDVGVMLTSDEEIGGKTSGMARIEAYRCGVCFLPDAGGKDQMSIGSKGVLELELTMTGKSGHAARPLEYVNPIYDLSDVIQKLRQAFPNVDPLATTASLTVVQAGKTFNQVPDSARLVADIRYIPEDDPKQLIVTVTAIAAACNGTVRIIELEPPFKADPSDPRLRQFIRHYQDQTSRHIELINAPGATDARFFAPQATPVIMIRPDGGGLHAPDESVSLSSLVEFTEVLTTYIAIIGTS